MVKGFVGRNFYLSNAYPVAMPFVMADGIQGLAPTLEHAFQASKTTDPERQRFILAAETVSASVRRGRSSDTKLRPDWDAQRRDVMRRLLRLKFSNPILQSRLMHTTGRLYNIDPSDDYWGCTFDEDGKVHGDNVLGILLQEYREMAYQEGWWREGKEDGVTQYYISVIQEDGGFRAWFGEVDFTQPSGFGPTHLAAIFDLVAGEADASGEGWVEDILTAGV